MPDPTSALAVPPDQATRYPTDAQLLDAVLRPYRRHCRYLRSGTTVAAGEPTAGGRLSIGCDFAIEESCYIDDTGHFNAVEFNMCFNQMFYYAIAMGIQYRLMYPFSRWTMDDFWKRQLPNFLIVDFHSVFRRAMRGRQFSGEIAVTRIIAREGAAVTPIPVIVNTTCRFWDESGGECSGTVKVAATDPVPLAG